MLEKLRADYMCVKTQRTDKIPAAVAESEPDQLAHMPAAS